MFGLKKKSGKEADLPLPEDLPPLDQDMAAPPTKDMPPIDSLSQDMPQIPSMPELNTHDSIPNDVTLSAPPMPQEPIDLPESPNPENFSEQIPEDISAREAVEIQLPEMPSGEPNLPRIPEVAESSEPMPMIDEDVPAPPAIFSDTGFYDTPEEIRHLVKEKQSRDKPSIDSAYDDVYNKGMDKIEAAGSEDVEKPEIRKEVKGPLFVDVDSFRTLLTDIETIRNDIKSSEAITQHLQEIKNSKDKEFERWQSQLEDIQKKINYVDKVLFNEA